MLRSLFVHQSLDAMEQTSEDLVRCEALLKSSEHEACLALADALLRSNPALWRVWRCRGCALFHVRLYAEARVAFRTALCASGGSLGIQADTMYSMIECCRLLENVERTGGDPKPGTHLRDGWFAQHLRGLIEAGTLSEPGIAVPSCSILECQHGPRHGPSVDHLAAQGQRDIHFAWDGGERDICAGELLPFPCTQGCDGEVFLKDRIFMFRCRRDDCYRRGLPCSGCSRSLPGPRFAFPAWAVELPATVQRPHPELDVLFARDLLPKEVHVKLIAFLDALANKRQDFPMPKYHNVIDPNIGAVDGMWVPTDVDVTTTVVRPFDLALCLMHAAVEQVGRKLPGHVAQRVLAFLGGGRTIARCLLAGRIPDLSAHHNAGLYWAVNRVLEAALPLLGQLRRPSLLLPGPLQVVVKAQRIHLAAAEDYAGVWHQDGLREHVVAVVLYYYRASSCLQGGALEFISRRTSGLWRGDAGGPLLSEAEVARVIGELPKGKVPIEEGTLVVFSNYQNIHRVLPMTSSAAGSRDFLAFFVLDQAKPLPTPQELPPLAERRARRGGLLEEQLQPKGRFGIDSGNVYSTGNGAVGDVGWVAHDEPSDSCWDADALAPVRCFNALPPLGRGISYLLSDLPEGWRWNPESSWAEYRIGPLDLSVPMNRVYVDPVTLGFSLMPPEDGLSDVRYFASVKEWLPPGEVGRSRAFELLPTDDESEEFLVSLQAALG